jgi:hypothetical protein
LEIKCGGGSETRIEGMANLRRKVLRLTSNELFDMRRVEQGHRVMKVYL